MTTDFIIWFRSNNGNRYYINKDFLPIRFREGLTFEEIVADAKQYTEKSYKRICTLLWKRYGNEIVEMNTDSISLHFKRYNTYEKNGILYVI
jgi:hypothetical protein